MFNRVVSILCSISILLTLCACGEKNSKGKKTSGSKTESTVQKPSSNVSSPESNKQSSEENLYKEHPELWTTKMVSLTFDDGPQESNGELLDILKEKGVKATFFLRGDNMEKYPELVKRMIAEGHDIGWHSYGHAINKTTTLERVQADFQKAQEILTSIGVDYKMKYLRCPGGSLSDNITIAATEQGWRIVNWSNYYFDDEPSSSASPQGRAEKTFATSPLRNGEVILIHPRTSDVAKGVGALIDIIQSKEFKAVSISELLQRRSGGTPGEIYAAGAPIF